MLKFNNFVKLVILLGGMLILAACTGDGNEFLGMPLTQATPVPTITPVSKQTATPAPEGTEDSSDEADNTVSTLLLWVPPMMDPNSGESAGDLLQAKLDAFEDEHPEVKIVVRVKAEEGPAGLIESLTAVSAVAPLELPSLVILDRSDLEFVAKRGLVLPIGDYSTLINDIDWFQYARSMSVISDSSYGLPLLGDALVMVIREEQFAGTAQSWEEIRTENIKAGFWLNDPESSLLLNYYLSLGGQLADDENQISLSEAELIEAYTLIKENYDADLMNDTLPDLTSYEDVWELYKSGGVDLAIVPSSYPLSWLPDDSKILPLVSITDYDYTLAKGWVIALADPLPERRALSVELAEVLTEVTFMGQWSTALGYLPVRDMAFEQWDATGTTVQRLSLISYSAHSYPSQEIVQIVAPALQTGLLAIINDGVSAEEAASIAIENLTVEE